MGPLGLLIVAFGLTAASEELERFERRATVDVAARLQGENKRVEILVEPTLTWGRLGTALITASDFEIEELPLFTEPELSKRGRLDRLKLDLHNFKLRGLLIDELKADIPDCRFDMGLALGKGDFRLSRSGVGTGRVRISEKALGEWLVEKFPEIKAADLRIYNDVVWLEGDGEFLMVKTPFTVIAKLSTEDGTKLNLVDAKVYFDWNRASPAAAKALVNTLNPVVDLSEDLGLYDAVSVEKIRLRGGFLEVQGPTKIPVKPASKTGGQ
jgi:hypothetical protein